MAALYSMIVITERLSKRVANRDYKLLLERAKRAFDTKLWNGNYYRFDATKDDVIMTDQLCGHWYLRATDNVTYEVFEVDRVRKSLRTIYENNVMGFSDGNMGSVNGYLYNQKRVDYSCIQSEEVWIGVNYALASTMIYEVRTFATDTRSDSS